MKILALDTSASACSLALLNDGQITTHHEVAPQQQAKTILNSIDELLQSAELELKQLTAIALGVGPGSFTGIRIATSVAQGLAFAHGLPIIPVSSLAALAQSAYEELGWERLLVAVDARLQEIYWGMYSVDSQGLVRLIEPESLVSPDLIMPPEAADWCGVGSGWSFYQDRLIAKLRFDLKAIDSTRLPMAKGVLSLAKIAYERGEFMLATEIQPVYLRNEVTGKS